MEQDFAQIAQAVKSNGVNGELVMYFRDIDPDEVKLEEPVFIYFDGLPVPFFIESLNRRSPSKAIVRLTDIESQTDSEEIVGKAIYVKNQKSGNDTQIEDGDLSALKGWTLYTPANGISDEDEEIEVDEIGTVSDFLDIPQNPCIEVETENGTAIIPFHEDLIIDLDPENREITMIIPEGLL